MTQVAVIGCGYWGPNLIRNFSALSRLQNEGSVRRKTEAPGSHEHSFIPAFQTTHGFPRAAGRSGD